MNKINLIGNLITDPFTIKPKTAKIEHRDAWPPSHRTKKEVYAEWKKKQTKKKKIEIKTIVMCGCGNHPINPKKDIYAQHNNWMDQFHPKTESGRSDIRNIKGIAPSPEKYTPTYDFSGDDFEMSPQELRGFNDKQ